MWTQPCSLCCASRQRPSPPQAGFCPVHCKAPETASATRSGVCCRPSLTSAISLLGSGFQVFFGLCAPSTPEKHILFNTGCQPSTFELPLPGSWKDGQLAFTPSQCLAVCGLLGGEGRRCPGHEEPAPHHPGRLCRWAVVHRAAGGLVRATLQ